MRIDNLSRVVHRIKALEPTQKQLILSVVIAAVTMAVLTPIQAITLGCGTTAAYIAHQEYREYRQLRRASIPAPLGKFCLKTFDKINQIEPWKRTLSFCHTAMNLCAGVFLLTNVFVNPGILIPAFAFGSLYRLTETFNVDRNTQFLKQQWTAVGLAGVAAGLLTFSPNPIAPYLLSAAIGYLATSYFIKMI